LFGRILSRILLIRKRGQDTTLNGANHRIGREMQCKIRI
jgi:hypothetical protein